jgi:hypothetical protein
MFLSELQTAAIRKILDNLFLKLKAKVLGEFFKGPKLYFQISRRANALETLAGIFKYSLFTTDPNATFDPKQVAPLANITGNYIDAEKNRALVRIIEGVQNGDPETLPEIIESSIDKSNNYIKMLVTTEVRTAQARGEMHGIQTVGASMGVADPTVVRLGVLDNRLCHICTKLWHMPNNVLIPRAYKVSELQEGYNTDRVNPVPTVAPSHPRCRHILTLVPPNMGYNEAGRLKFMGFGYDMYAEQHKELGKSETNISASPTMDISQFVEFSMEHEKECPSCLADIPHNHT